MALQSLLPLAESLRARLGDSEKVEVIDWCSGSGNASLVLAYLLPQCHFTLIDKQVRATHTPLRPVLARREALKASTPPLVSKSRLSFVFV